MTATAMMAAVLTAAFDSSSTLQEVVMPWRDIDRLCHKAKLANQWLKLLAGERCACRIECSADVTKGAPQGQA